MVNPRKMSQRLVPVWSKNDEKIVTCDRMTTKVMNRMSKESITRSVTTVPRDFRNEVPSYLAKTPHRLNSPLRGITRLDA